MDGQLPRRRASGNVRDQASAYHSAPQVDTQPTPLGIQDEAVKNEEHSWNGASAFRVAKEQHQQRNTSRPCKQRSSKVFEAGVAIVLFALLLLSLFESQTQFIFNAESAGSLKLKAGIHIPLHPEEHIHRPPTEIELRWSVTTGFRAPDGVKKRVYLINGAFPGPTIEVRSGDTLKVHVQNDIGDDEGLSIHWHGLNMKAANEMDGAVGFTQCPILKDETFTYEFNISDDQDGTFWYHAHSQLQRADGLYGGLIVHRPAAYGVEFWSEHYGYNQEVLLLVGDWYHRSADEIMQWYLSARSFGNEPVPDSLLINGAGRFDCSMAAPARPLDCKPVSTPSLFFTDFRPIRFRVVNTGSLAGFKLSMSQANMLAIQVDGGSDIEAEASNSVGTIYPGERVDIIVHWNTSAAHGGRGLRISLDEEDFAYPNPSLVSEQDFPVSFGSRSHPRAIRTYADEEPFTDFDLQAAHSRRPLPVSSAPPQQIVLYTTTMKLSKFNNIPKGFMNHTSWQPQSSPNIPLLFLPRSSWDNNQFIPWIEHPESDVREARWVDIIVNNLDDGGHPFHLHGHDFYVLATYRSYRGWGSFNPFTTSSELSPGGAYELDRPLKKDTVFIPRRGYAVLRFLADNPGIWMFHCHILWHQASGMAMGFQVGGSESYGFVSSPSDRPNMTSKLCGRSLPKSESS